jgi:hypothetical protein
MGGNMNLDDNFFKAFNTSRCKTAMLIITFFVMLAFLVTESLAIPNTDLHTLVIIIIGYWAGRTSKGDMNGKK